MASTKQLAPLIAVLVSFHLLVSCGADPPRCDHKGHLTCSLPAASKRGTALMTANEFNSGDFPAACDDRYHSDHDMVVALSTEWYAGGRRCFKLIRITSARTGRTVEAKVVDECDSSRGCGRNILETSPAVWKALGLDTNVDMVPVTWSDV